VHADHGGLTHWKHYTHRVRCANHFVLPAGYLGSAAWGGIILVCCSRAATTHAIAMVLAIFLIIALGYSFLGVNERRDDWTLSKLCIGMLVALVGMLTLCHYSGWPLWDMLLRKMLLLLGTMNTLFATYDIWDDCVVRSSERSDACRYAELLGLPMASGRCVGVAWLCTSLWLTGGALLLALRLLPPGPPVRGVGDLHVSSCLFFLCPVSILIAAAAHRWPVLTAAVTAGGRSQVRPWASVSHLSPQPLRDVLLADWRGVDGKREEHRGGSWQASAAIKVASGADVPLQMWTQDEEEDVALFLAVDDEE